MPSLLLSAVAEVPEALAAWRRDSSGRATSWGMIAGPERGVRRVTPPRLIGCSRPVLFHRWWATTKGQPRLYCCAPWIVGTCCAHDRERRPPELRGELLGATAIVIDDPVESEALARQAVEIGRANGKSNLELMALHAVG